MALLGLPGCYLLHLAHGQTRLLWARRPLAEVLEDSSVPAETRAQLELVDDVRSFAEEIGLTVDGQYTSYAEWPGDRIVTSVVATRPGELDPLGFWFPIVGTVPYKGYFDPARAEAEEARLRARGFDVCRVAVPAYSTLGWLDDPVTGPMVRSDQGRFVETLLHELVHANVYVESRAGYNEGVATFVGQEGALRFFAERDGPDAPSTRQLRQRIAEDREIARSLAATRTRIAGLYEQPPSPARDAARASIEREARDHVAALTLQVRAPVEMAERIRLNDACLALTGTYEDDLDAYAARLRALDGDLARFVEAALEAAERPDPSQALLGPIRDPDSGTPPASRSTSP